MIRTISIFLGGASLIWYAYLYPIMFDYLFIDISLEPIIRPCRNSYDIGVCTLLARLFLWLMDLPRNLFLFGTFSFLLVLIEKYAVKTKLDYLGIAVGVVIGYIVWGFFWYESGYFSYHVVNLLTYIMLIVAGIWSFRKLTGKGVGSDGSEAMGTSTATFRMAPMCRLISVITFVSLMVPVLLLVASLLWSRFLLYPAFIVLAIYAWVWLGFRPTWFIVESATIEIVWPLKRRMLDRSTISQVKIINAKELKSLVGWGVRVGAGGLWGGFGWLWTERRGIVQMYISRLDQFVWIERTVGRAWIITPENPEDFVRALAA